MSPFLTLNAFDRPVGGLLVGLAIQCHTHRKATRRIFSDYLDAGNSLTSGPLPNRIEAFFTQRSVVQSVCFRFRRHAVKDNQKSILSLLHLTY